MLNRLNKELQDLTSRPVENCSVCLVGEDLQHWRLFIRGPASTPYEGGSFEVNLAIPENYPFSPPEAHFTTKIFHPNVQERDGEICSQIYQGNWVPSLNIRYIAEILVSMLSSPMPEHAVESEIAAMMINNPEQFHRTAQEWMRKYALS